MLQHQLYASDALSELEMELVRSSYLHGNPNVGWQSLGRLYVYDVANSEPWRDRLDALIQIADWALLFAERKALALEIYEQAYAELQREGRAQAAIEQVFSPETPVVLPTFLPNPLASEKTAQSSGYIDVAFDVTQYGRGRRVEILDTTTNAPHAAKDRVVRLIARSHFRPSVTDGQVARRAAMVVRYYLNE
jgi:hypothetical protein